MLKALIYLENKNKMPTFADENVGVADLWYHTTQSD
jgi:hypothetical protein